MPAIKHRPLVNPTKTHGGKSLLAKRIVSLFPPKCKTPNAPESTTDGGYVSYVEPYFGGGSVLLENNPSGISEVVSDTNKNLTNFWKVLQRNDWFLQFQRTILFTPFSQLEWLASQNHVEDEGEIERAIKFFIHCRQSLAGRGESFAPITKNRTRRGMNEQVSAWLNCIEGMPEVHKRLIRVVILNQPALKVIQKQDGPRTLFYLDPPYLPETRQSIGQYGEHEMLHVNHVELLEAIDNIEGRFVLSGYRSQLYDSFAKRCGWNRVDFDVPNNASGAKLKRRMIECVWMNY